MTSTGAVYALLLWALAGISKSIFGTDRADHSQSSAQTEQFTVFLLAHKFDASHEGKSLRLNSQSCVSSRTAVILYIEVDHSPVDSVYTFRASFRVQRQILSVNLFLAVKEVHILSARFRVQHLVFNVNFYCGRRAHLQIQI